MHLQSTFLERPITMSRKKQNVLDEDSFTRSIASIIERDFFPDSELLALENAYLEAESQNDFETMKNLTIRRKQLADKTPATMRGQTTERGFIPATPTEPGATDGHLTPEKKEEDDETKPNPDDQWDYRKNEE